jgi:exodeoxyribonuclease V gamma subunit
LNPVLSRYAFLTGLKIMPNIKLYTSNRLEILADRIASVVSQPLSNPFKTEIIVVQSKGMERWVSMQLAERLGIWSNCRYYFPNQIIMEIFRQIIPDIRTGRIFDTEIITWQIMKILPGCVSKRGFESLKNYLNGSDSTFKLFQLSSKIADTFDQYLTYRPDMIIEWSDGKGKDWQAELWRLLKNELPNTLPPELHKKFFELTGNYKNINFKLLPERISVFGISSMPVFHIDILSAIAEYIDVNFFFMNPSREYWADISPEKNIAKTLGKYDKDITTNKLHLEKGNSLLASMGELGRDFLSVLLKNDYQEYPDFVEPGNSSLLCSLQSDILNMTDRGISGQDNSLIKFSEKDILSDTSVRVHSCHSPMREVEVLYDNLLDMFNKDPELEPRDILVMMPDINVYSPYISAIFNTSHDDNKKVSYSIADKSILKDNILIDAFFSVLDLNNSRFEAVRVLDILECDKVQQKYDLSSGNVQLIRRWIKDTNIKWGVDAKYKEKNGLPGYNENTWRSGIERMLLGYAMPGEQENIFKGILPYDIEGNESIILGKFIMFYNSLSRISELIQCRYSLCKWSNILKEIHGMLFTSEPDQENDKHLREAFNILDELENNSGFHEEVELRIIKSWLENHLEEKQTLSGFMTGNVTFCAMLPMRSIPFKVICLLGMNDANFPRTTISTAFNLIALNPAKGDRSRRKDDRYLFLESLISARKKVYISFTGQSIQDNTAISPSVVVSELLDYIKEGYKVDGKNILDYILIKHPLQAFSPKYFSKNENIFSYSEINFRTAMSAVSERKESAQFINGKLSESYTWPENKAIELDELISFFHNPVKYLLKTRLGIYLKGIEEITDDNEPFDIKGFERYKIEDFICGEIINGRDISALYNTFRARGMIPHGNIGKVAFNHLLPGLMHFTERVKSIAGEHLIEPVKVDLNISGYRLTGYLDRLYPSGMIQYRYADTKAKDRIKSWVKHLVLNSLKLGDYSSKSILICKDASWETEPIESSDILKELIILFIKGNNELLNFFPETSFEYANSFLTKGSHADSLNQAGKKWIGNDYSTGECSDLYYELCFGTINPLNNTFADLSMRVFEFLIKNQKKTGI